MGGLALTTFRKPLVCSCRACNPNPKSPTATDQGLIAGASNVALTTLLLILLTTGCTYHYPPIDRTFRVAWANPARSIDPRYLPDADSSYLADFLHCSLNQLATKTRWIGPKTLEVALSDHYHFWNGEPVTASDVKASYDFFLSTLASPQKSDFKSLSSVEIISPHLIQFHLSSPDADFTENLSQGILPKNLALGPRISDPAKIMGCGPFQLDEWVVGHIQLKRTPPDHQDVQYIRFEVVRDENTRLLKLRNSEIDLAHNSINRDQLTHLERFPNLRMLRHQSTSVSYLGIQFKDPILAIRNVRRAISMAIHREKIIEHVLHGWATPAIALLNRTSPYFDPSGGSALYDPVLAMKLLDEAGFPMQGSKKDQPRLKLKLSTSINPSVMMCAYSISDDLKKVGINLEVESKDWGKFKDDVDRGAVQMWLLLWPINRDGLGLYDFVFETTHTPPNGANRGWYSNPNLDAALKAAKEETNMTRRKISAARIQRIVQEELPYIFLWHEDNIAVVNKRVQGFEVHAEGGLTSIKDVKFK